MAATPKTLTKATKFSRTTPSGYVISMELPAGAAYRYERTEDATHIIHTAKVTHDGYVWVNAVRTPKHPETLPVPAAPVAPAVVTVAQTQASLNTTAKDVSHAIGVIAGRQVKGLDAVEKDARRLEKAVKMLSGRVYQVNYYHPDTIKDQIDQGFRKVFRKHGYHFDGSNWAFPEDALNHPQVQAVFAAWDAIRANQMSTRMPGRKLRSWKIEYTAEQLADMKDQAQEQLAETLREIHTALIERINDADCRLKAAQEALSDEAAQRDADKLDNAYNGSVRASLRDACETFEMCLRGAELFDDHGNLDDLFASTRAAIRTQTATANVMLRAKRVKTVKLPAAIG